MANNGSNHFYNSKNSNFSVSGALNSNKGFANQIRKYVGNPTDKTDKLIYQINTNGEIVKVWKGYTEIAEFFGVFAQSVRYYVLNNKIVSDCLFIKMMDYKSSIDYKVLIKYYKYAK
jgi:hypothetical protein